MVQMTMQLSDELAARVKPLQKWLPTILELSLVGFKTPATETAGEIIEFLSKQPSPQRVLNYFVSERSQARTRRLFALNQAGLLNEFEQRELDELEKIEHIMTLLKIEVASQSKKH